MLSRVARACADLKRGGNVSGMPALQHTSNTNPRTRKSNPRTFKPALQSFNFCPQLQEAVEIYFQNSPTTGADKGGQSAGASSPWPG